MYVLKYKAITMVILSFFVTKIAYSQETQQSALLEDLYAQHSMDTKNSSLNPFLIDQQNQLEIIKTNNSKILNGSIKTNDFISFEQAKKILDLSKQHAVVGPEALSTYDPQGNFGFCFGRACYFHLDLLSKKISKESIKKVWMVGPMVTNDVTWQFHVATAVRTAKNKWLVLDHEFESPITIEEWYNFWKKTSPDGRVKLYITEPQRFGASAGKYSNYAFKNQYNYYFRDILNDFKQRSLEKQRIKNSCKKLF